MAGARDIREEVDREIEAYGGAKDLVLLIPEDRWDEFLRLTGAVARDDEVQYCGVAFRKAAVTAVVAQEGF
jgi:hypothetical protein